MSDDLLLVDAVEDYVRRSVLPLAQRLVALEQELASRPPVEKGADGSDGKDAEVDYALVADMLKAMLTNVPPGKPGADGKDAEVDYDRVGNIIAVAVEKEVGKRPPASVDYAAIGNMVQTTVAAIPPAVVDEAAIVERVRAFIPPAVPGDKGDKGDKGDAGDKGDKGLDGSDGRRGLSAFEIARQHGYSGDAIAWLASMRGKDGADGASVQTSDVVLMVREAMADAVAALPVPKDGRDGRDALDGLAEVQCEMSDDRTLELRFVRNGGAVTVQRVKLHHTIYRGVHTDGAAYERGDSVTRDGSTWIALHDTTEPPGGAAKDWQLAVKRGRDGR